MTLEQKDEKMLHEALNSIQTPAYDIYSVVRGQLAQTQKSFQPRKKLAAVLIASCAILALTLAVMAAIPSFTKLLGIISPEQAQELVPVQLSCVCDGIKIEVVAVSRYDRLLRAYIAVRDMEGKNRVSEKMSFRDYSSLMSSGGVKTPNNPANGAAAIMGNSLRVLDYDKESQTATIEITAESQYGFEGQNLTFKAQKLFYNDQKLSAYIPLNYLENPETIAVPYADNPDDKKGGYIASGSLTGGYQLNSFVHNESLTILKPKQAPLSIPDCKNSIISNAGIIDGLLHIQVFSDTSHYDSESRPDLYFKDDNGETRYPPVYYYIFSTVDGKPVNVKDISGTPPYALTEYIFDQDPKDLAGYHLYADFTTSDVVDGDWRITFPADIEAGKTIEKECNVPVSNFIVTHIKINPLSIIIETNRTISTNKPEGPALQLDTGSVLVGIPWSSGTPNGTFVNDTYISEIPVKVELIKAVVIDGCRIDI